MTTYLVSGDEDIRPSHENLRRKGKRVRFDTQIHEEPSRAIKSGRRYIVIAHGNSSGTVKLFRTDWNESRRWLYVGMGQPPSGARIYLYSCHAGRKLPRFLRNCLALGHVDVVPTPVGGAAKVVLRFLNRVEQSIKGDFDASQCREELGRFVNSALIKALDGGDILDVPTLVMLRRSLGNPDYSDE